MTGSACFGRPVRLSPCEFTACWDALDLGDTPIVLTRCGPGNSFDAASMVRMWCRGQLGATAHYGGHGGGHRG